MTNYLYSTLGVDSELPILEKWVEHYLSLGFCSSRMRFVLQTRNNLGAIQAVKQRLAKYSIKPALVWRGHFSSGKNYRFRKQIWQSLKLRANDWFFIADSDEFHTFERPLNELVSLCNQTGFNAIQGKLIDCVAAGGRLPRLNSQAALNKQFPVHTHLTRDLLKMNDLKIIAHKHNTFAGRMYRANHGISPEFGPAKVIKQQCEIKHYKWIEGVLEHIKKRADHYSKIGRETDAKKNYEFLRLVSDNQGRIPIDILTPFYYTPNSAA